MTASNSQNEAYNYGTVGNRSSSHLASSYTYKSGQFNQVATAVGSSQTLSYNYDANGSMTSKSDGTTTWQYTWDFENRMTSAGNGTSQVDYTYDALGRRVSRDDGTDATNFTYEGSDVLIDDVGGAQTKYINGLGVDNKLKQTAGSTASYFIADHLGSTNALTDSSGAITASNSYDSFGNSTNASFPTRYRFTGREYDSITGLQFSRARWYDASIGRFISEDPIGLAGGINQYGYVGNNPGNFIDPSGLFPFQIYGDPTKFWTNGANQMDGYIERERRALTGLDPDAIDRNTNVNFAARMASGTVDLLRVGTDAGYAIYCEDMADYRRLELFSGDVVRGGTLFLMMAAPAAGRLGAAGESAVAEVPPASPGEYLAGKAPNQVTPGITTLKGYHVNDMGRVEPWTAHYDQYGRLIGRTDYNAGNVSQGIPSTHYHTYEYGPGYGPNGKETGRHIPGEYPGN